VICGVPSRSGYRIKVIGPYRNAAKGNIARNPEMDTDKYWKRAERTFQVKPQLPGREHFIG